MGLYDREYGRDDNNSWQPGVDLGGGRSLTTNLVLLTAGVYVLQVVTQPAAPRFSGDNGWVTNWFSLHADTLMHPWQVFGFLTYGFLHSPADIKHILFNMFGFWMFGRTVEQRYGRSEYLAFYLVAIVFAGATWYVSEYFANGAQDSSLHMLGASGGLSAVLILFALNFPRQRVYIWGILGVPAWIFALFFVGSDVIGAMDRTNTVACTAHLGGALFAYLYFRSGWKLADWFPQSWSLPRPRKRSDLRIHEPDPSDSATDDRVDEILKKIQAEGQDSLTRRERRILEKASREYQRKRP